jgi:putative oxidoreductase
MNNAWATLHKLHAGFVTAASYLQSPFLLLVRLYWGWQFTANGWAKLHNLSHVTEFFTSLGLPAPHFTAVFVSTVECVGGVLLAIGLLSRLTGLALTIDMMTAYIVSDRAALTSIISDPGKFYNADPYTFLFAALLVLIFGPGKLSLDTLLERRMRQRDSH